MLNTPNQATPGMWKKKQVRHTLYIGDNGASRER